MPRLRLPLACASLLVLCHCASPSYRKPSASEAGNDGGEDGSFPLRNPDSGSRGAMPDGTLISRLPTGSAEAGADEAGPNEPAADAASQQPAEQPTDPLASPTVPGDIGPRTPVIPEWATSMRGPYASRAFAYRQDEFDVMTGSTVISLHQFVLTEGGLVLRTKPCDYRAATVIAELRMVDPSQVPERSENVLFSDTSERWSSDGDAVQYGFTRELPAICSNKLGEYVPKPPAQVWSSSTTCRCADVADEPLPDDCRVLDPDGDQQPGFTFHLHGTTIPGESDLFGAIDADSHYVNGQLHADGTLRANIRAAENNYQLGCKPSDCANIAKIGKWCPTTFNYVDFVPLTDEAPSCESVLAAQSKLFPEPAAPAPTRCYQ